jgi:hypothetical protein
MSLKQISFSPELLDTPEVKDITLPQQSNCTMTTQTDLSQIDYVPLPINLQAGGSQNIEELDDMKELTKVSFDDEDKFQQSGGKFDIKNKGDVTMDEVKDNPDEDQIDDIIDENDHQFETSEGKNIGERLKEIRQFEQEVSVIEENQHIKKLEETKIDNDIEFDLHALNDKLAEEMDLYWDKELDITYVERKVEEYIENYNSNEYKTYRSMFMYVLSKTKIGYKVDVSRKGDYILHKGNMDEYEIKLTPPKYIYLNTAVDKLENNLKDLEFNLYDLKTELIDNVDRILEEDLTSFRKMQKKYYDIKHQIAIYNEYYDKINKKDNDEIDIFLNFIKKKTNSKNEILYVIDTNYIKVPLAFQENLKKSKISSLELYNQVKNMYHKQSKTKITKAEQKEFHTLVKKYLNTGNTQSVINIIGQYQKHLKKHVDFIIEKKPIIDVAKNKPKNKPEK